MCQSYRKVCTCGKHTTEIFFGRMILDETSVAKVYCPDCSQNIETDRARNGEEMVSNLE